MYKQPEKSSVTWLTSRWAKQNRIHGLESNFLLVDGVFDAEDIADEVEVVDGQPGKHSPRDFVFFE